MRNKGILYLLFAVLAVLFSSQSKEAVPYFRETVPLGTAFSITGSAQSNPFLHIGITKNAPGKTYINPPARTKAWDNAFAIVPQEGIVFRAFTDHPAIPVTHYVSRPVSSFSPLFRLRGPPAIV